MASEHLNRAPGDRARAHEGPPGAPWSLRVEDKDGGLTWHALESHAYDVGREVEHGIRLASREVSRLHARLERDGAGDWWIVPKARRSDTLVNGRPARQSHLLAPWDDVQLGGFHLRLVPRDVRPTPERLHELLIPFLEDGVTDRPPPARVRIYEGPLGGHDVRLDKGIVVFGSWRDATVPLDGRRDRGVCVEFRATREGFEVVDRSERPSMTVNGHVLPRFHLTSDELVGIGDVERQRRDGRDALRVRFLPSERRPGVDTSPAALETVRSAPGSDGELGSTSATGADATDPTAPVASHELTQRDTALDRAAPHEGPDPTPPVPTPQAVDATSTGEPTSSPTLLDAGVGPTSRPVSSAPPTMPPSPPSSFPPSFPPSSGGSREPITEPAPPPTVPPPSTRAHVEASRADARSVGRLDAPGRAESEAGARRPLGWLALVLAAVAAFAAVAWRLGRGADPSPSAGDGGPKPTASHVATTVPGTSSASSPAGGPSARPPVPAPSAPTVRTPVAPVPSATPRTTTTTPPAKPPRGATTVPSERENDPDDDAQGATRRRLETKAKAGRATTGELQTLLTLCLGQRDAACVALAKAQLANQEAP